MIIEIASRYAFSKIHRQRRASFIVIIGIAIGLAALIVVIGIMNSLQSSMLAHIRDTDSFDITIRGDAIEMDSIAAIDGVGLAFNYIDASAMIMNSRTGADSYARLRGISQSLAESERFKNALSIRGNLEGFVPGSALAGSLGLRIGESVKVMLLKKGSAARLIPFSAEQTVHGVHYSSNPDFSGSTILMPLSLLSELSGTSDLRTGIYLSDGADLEDVQRRIQALVPEGAVVTTWKQANSALYSALLLEKGMVSAFLGFIIIIVSFYLKRSASRLIAAKRKEAAVFQALGMRKSQTVAVFLVQALEISLLGVLLGIGLGFLFSSFIRPVISGIETLLKGITGSRSMLSAYPLHVAMSFGETALFSVAILACTFLFALAGSAAAFKINIMEILKDDTRS